MPFPPAPAAPRTQSRPAAAQPRPTVADQIERLTPQFDDLVRRARLVVTPSGFDDLEERVHAFNRALRATVRERTPHAAPLWVGDNGAMF